MFGQWSLVGFSSARSPRLIGARPERIGSTSFSFCIALAAMLTSCGGHHEEHEGHDLGRYPATSPLLADTTVRHEYVCRSIRCSTSNCGHWRRATCRICWWTKGQHVKEGQLMFRIRPVLYQAEVERAQAEAEFARDRIPQHEGPGGQQRGIAERTGHGQGALRQGEGGAEHGAGPFGVHGDPCTVRRDRGPFPRTEGKPAGRRGTAHGTIGQQHACGCTSTCRRPST